MKVLNLQCDSRHGFEGWFASEQDFTRQLEQGLVQCPLCGVKSVRKLPSAPRLNLSTARQDSPAAALPQQQLMAGNAEQTLQAAWLQVARRIVEQTEDVGDRFAEEARKIHYGETEERGIRGQATREETAALLEEGVSVLPLPLPDALKGTIQ